MYFNQVCPRAQIAFLFVIFPVFFFNLSLIMPLNCILVIMGDGNLSEKRTLQGFGRVVFIQVLL